MNEPNASLTIIQTPTGKFYEKDKEIFHSTCYVVGSLHPQILRNYIETLQEKIDETKVETIGKYKLVRGE